ncbi:MAG TPA: hypothetical protein PLS51_06510 [Flavobacterium sp.]|nr:hypothetical protein [Flavobacterium sp.]HPJ10265.1 hypothetical protein [Flavobacterium sp.]
MKKTRVLFSILLLAFFNSALAQFVIKADGGTTNVEGTDYFKIIKKDKT